MIPKTQNHLIGRNLLPIGVVPVTAVVTEIRYGACEQARAHLRDGRDAEVPLDQIGGYIAEKENPENVKQVADIRVGRVFDRNWELLSPVLPVWTIQAAVHRHFRRTIGYLVDQNLSRVSAQWEESINGALWGIEKEARRRLDELIETVEHLVQSGRNEREPQLRADLERIERARKSLVLGARR